MFWKYIFIFFIVTFLACLRSIFTVADQNVNSSSSNQPVLGSSSQPSATATGGEIITPPSSATNGNNGLSSLQSIKPTTSSSGTGTIYTVYILELYSFLRIRRTLTTYYDVAAFLLHCILRANGHLILRRSLFHEIVFIIYLCFLASILIFQQQVKVSIPHHPVNKLSSLLSEVLLLQETRLSPLRRDQPMAIIKFPHCKAAGRLLVQLV